jgi:RNA polymerase sigma-70 factor (ECF subfamily)
MFTIQSHTAIRPPSRDKVAANPENNRDSSTCGTKADPKQNTPAAERFPSPHALYRLEMQNAITLTMAITEPTDREIRSKHEAEIATGSFALLVQCHSQLLYRIAMAVTHNPHDAEDTVQEAFLQLYRTSHWPQIDDPRSYLARIAWRLAVRRAKRSSSKDLAQELTGSLTSQGESPESAAIDEQTQSWLHARIDALPEKLRQPLALTALGELSSPEIAAILGIPEGTVRRRIHTARQLLRRQWDARNGGRA